MAYSQQASAWLLDSSDKTAALSEDDGSGAWWLLPLHERVYSCMPSRHVDALGAAVGELGFDFFALSESERMYFHCALASQEACGEIALVDVTQPLDPPKLVTLCEVTRLPFEFTGNAVDGESWFELLAGIRPASRGYSPVRFPLGEVNGVHAALLHLSDGGYFERLPNRLRTMEFATAFLPACYQVRTESQVPSPHVLAAIRAIVIEATISNAHQSTGLPAPTPPRRRTRL